MVKVVFVHPDLGIGGAERLVVDAALALKAKGHQVHFLTSHHDPSHCFEETRNGELPVTTVGDWLPRHLLGRFHALFAYLRMAAVALYLTFMAPPELALKAGTDVIFVDQVSACIPLLWLGPNRPRKVVFYCHFPDLLLSQGRSESWIKRAYRMPLDFLEEKTTSMADTVLVNSNFTAGIFHDTFKSITKAPKVLYPSLNTVPFDLFVQPSEEPSDSFTILSVNRYERKKNLPLAIKALANLVRILGAEKGSRRSARLIMIGGYDTRVAENVEHLEELRKLSEELGMASRVEFRTSTPTEEKLRLLRTADVLAYTPSGEHFGIVPLEAMYSGLPVVAVADGGPLETVVDGSTGFLCSPTEASFSAALAKLAKGGPEMKRRMGQAGKDRVKASFSFNCFADQLDQVIIA